MALLYNNQNEQRKREMEQAYKDSMQMQQYQQNKQNMFDKAGSMLGAAKNGYDKYKMGSGIASKFGGGSFGNNTGGGMNGVGGGLTAAKGAMDVGSDLQRKDYTNAGLDTAKTAASFFGPWGMAAAAAIQMYQNFRSAKQKKAQEAAMKGMEDLQKSEKEANEKKGQAMQALEQQNAENEAEVDEMAQQAQTPNELKQDIAGQVLYPQYQAVDRPNITGVNEQQTAPQGSYNVSNSQMSSSPVAKEIMSQVQQPDYSNYNSPYSYEEIQQEMMRRGMR